MSFSNVNMCCPMFQKFFKDFKKNILVRMVDFKVIKIDENDKIFVVDESQVSFYTSIVYPLVESYWSVILNLFTLA